MLSIKDWRVLGPKKDKLTPPAKAQGSNRQKDCVVDSFSKTMFPRQSRAGAQLCVVTVTASTGPSQAHSRQSQHDAGKVSCEILPPAEELLAFSSCLRRQRQKFSLRAQPLAG